MTDRLYYNDAYLTEFTATVVRVEAGENGKSVVYLDRSAFYPTSGGQPFDTGDINGFRVTDVYVDKDGDVAHVISGALNAGDAASGHIDWVRRFDHMQQHAGEHMLAGCVYRQLGGRTIGLHLGHEDSSIDVDLPDGRTRIEPEELSRLEDEVNARIQADEPIKCWFPDEDELKSLPLRKAPAVSEHVRVVRIGDDEFCACGGTHPSSAGQIGLVKIIDARPSKGKLRLTFVCGKRAFLHYRKQFEAIKQLSSILSADVDALASAANDLVKRLKDAQYRLEAEKTERALETAKNASEQAIDLYGASAVVCRLGELGADGLKRVAAYITQNPGRIALISSRSEQGCTLLFARSADVSCDMGRLLNAAAKAAGGKGGGSSEFARGSAQSDGALEAALDMLRNNGDEK